MQRVFVLLIPCSSVLDFAGAQHDGQSQMHDLDEVGLLQSSVGKHTGRVDDIVVFMGECPREHMRPHCRSGTRGNPGFKLLDDGKCLYHCRQFQSGRFCGEGSFFETGNSVDCKACGQPKAAFADFALSRSSSIEGKLFIDVEQKTKDSPGLVGWKVEDLKIDPKLIAKGCGKLLHGKPTFNYHLHEQWNFPAHQTSSVFDCSLAKVGNHWDPTAACGPASGNPVCDKGFCNTRGKNYTCNPKFFDPLSRYQYRLLTPSALNPGGATCEFGDFSGMTGPIEAEVDQHTREVRQEKPHDGKAAMSATFGEIYPHTLQGRPFLSCAFETLPIQGEKRLTYEQATVKTPLDKFPKDASVLVHCGDNYEKANARFFCALLQGRK